jgi:type VI secretion system secreted protein VgrG
MADYRKFFPFVVRWEGGYVNDPDDSGGATNRGIIWTTYKSLAKSVLGVNPSEAHFRSLTKTDAEKFFMWFWNKATYNNSVRSQAISEVLTSWFWGSGGDGLESFQKMLNAKFGQRLSVDGVIGRNSIEAINSLDEKKIFTEAIKWREQFFRDLVKRRPKDAKFLNGWLNRLKSFSERHKNLLVAGGLSLGMAFFFGFIVFKLFKN